MVGGPKPTIVSPRIGALGCSYSETPAGHLDVQPIPVTVARDLIISHHYLGSFPGGTRLSFGIFIEKRLLGALTFGVGSKESHRLVSGAGPGDCLTLTRFWISDELGKNSESHVIGLALRNLRRHTSIKFVLSYADPTEGHRGVIYQASNFIYTGLSVAMPKYDLGDGIARNSRTLGQIFGTHSIRYFMRNGIDIRLIPQVPKHRYIYFLDRRWRTRLTVPILPYPKAEEAH